MVVQVDVDLALSQPQFHSFYATQDRELYRQILGIEAPWLLPGFAAWPRLCSRPHYEHGIPVFLHRKETGAYSQDLDNGAEIICA
jgi:hypothetical protein